MNGTSLGICGLGLIGSSIGRNWLDRGPVLAFDPEAEALSAAKATGFATTSSLEEIAQTDLVVLAAPTSVNVSLLAELMAGPARPITMDAGSAKGAILHEWQTSDPSYPFIGTHPMAGSERAGFASGDAALFDDAAWPVVVADDTDPAALVVVLELIRGLGAWPIPVDADEHDRAVAAISHLPHLLTGALGQVVADSDVRGLAVRLAAGSFRDLSRISGSPSLRTAEFIAANRAQAARQAREAAADLEMAAGLLESDDEVALGAWLEPGHAVRAEYEARGTQDRVTAELLDAEAVKSVLVEHRNTGDRVTRLVHSGSGWDLELAVAAAVAGQGSPGVGPGGDVGNGTGGDGG